MDLRAFLKKEGEQPLDRIVQNGGFCGIFRKIVCVGDSLSSGEMEGMMDGKRIYSYGWYDAFAKIITSYI